MTSNTRDANQALTDEMWRVAEIRREELGLAPAAVSRRMGAAKSYYRSALASKSAPSYWYMLALAKALEMPLAKLVGNQLTDREIRILEGLRDAPPEKAELLWSMIDAALASEDTEAK